jgi:hypothetical protein
MFIRCISGKFGREVTKYMVKYDLQTCLANPMNIWFALLTELNPCTYSCIGPMVSNEEGSEPRRKGTTGIRRVVGGPMVAGSQC